jgi:hypothetical protein
MIKMTKDLEKRTSPIALIKSTKDRVAKVEQKIVGSSGVAIRSAPTPTTKNKRKIFNRLFRDSVEIGDIIKLPNGNYAFYEGHAQGRKAIDKKTYYVQYSTAEGFNPSSYKREIFEFPENLTFRDGVYHVDYIPVIKRRA